MPNVRRVAESTATQKGWSTKRFRLPSTLGNREEKGFCHHLFYFFKKIIPTHTLLEENEQAEELISCAEFVLSNQDNFRPAPIPDSQPSGYDDPMKPINPPQPAGNLTESEKRILYKTSYMKKKNEVNMNVGDITFTVIIFF